MPFSKHSLPHSSILLSCFSLSSLLSSNHDTHKTPVSSGGKFEDSMLIISSICRENSAFHCEHAQSDLCETVGWLLVSMSKAPQSLVLMLYLQHQCPQCYLERGEALPAALGFNHSQEPGSLVKWFRWGMSLQRGIFWTCHKNCFDLLEIADNDARTLDDSHNGSG